MIEILTSPTFILAVLTSIAVGATILTVAMPLLAGDNLEKRKKSMAVERNKIRLKERARLMAENKGGRASLRGEPKAFMKEIVEKFNLREYFLGPETKNKLMRAGYRGESTLVVYLFTRLVVPIVTVILGGAYLFFINDFDQPPLMLAAMVGGIGVFGFFLPDLVLASQAQKRQQSIKRAWPDALDLMLICVESGVSIENAFRRVSVEMIESSVPLCEEMALTTAELSYLEDRRKAFENLATRTGLEGVKAATTALTQAEKYGTPLGHSMRVMAQENRDMRMAEAEKKAAALPPKLTVPMIVFFLPCLFVVILGPAIMQVFEKT